MSGDGGAAGIDVKNKDLRYHTYFGPQGDVNFHGNNQKTWDWYMDPLIFSGEGASFYVPFQADPVVSKTAYVGLNSVWRTQDGGGDPNFLDNHCFTDGGPKGDMLFTGACGDWMSLGQAARQPRLRRRPRCRRRRRRTTSSRPRARRATRARCGRRPASAASSSRRTRTRPAT